MVTRPIPTPTGYQSPAHWPGDAVQIDGELCFVDDYHQTERGLVYTLRVARTWQRVEATPEQVSKAPITTSTEADR